MPASDIIYTLLIDADIEAVRKTITAPESGAFDTGFNSAFDTETEPVYQYRIYQSIIEANVPLPYIAILCTGYDDVTTLKGPTGMENHNYQVAVVDEDMRRAVELTGEIRQILDWYHFHCLSACRSYLPRTFLRGHTDPSGCVAGSWLRERGHLESLSQRWYARSWLLGTRLDSR